MKLSPWRSALLLSMALQELSAALIDNSTLFCVLSDFFLDKFVRVNFGLTA